MASNLLPQSTTTIAKTPPPVGENTKNSPKRRLELYHSLFVENNNGIDSNGGLLSTRSLNFSLYTLLHLGDENWVLAMIDIDRFKDMNKKLEYSAANMKISHVGDVILQFCSKLKLKLKGYKCDDIIKGKDDLFAVLMNCAPNLNTSEKYVSKLMKQIKSVTNETVSIGIAKMNNWETYEEWKLRALTNLNKVKEGAKGQDDFYTDVNVVFRKPQASNSTTNGVINDEHNEDETTPHTLGNGNAEEFKTQDDKIQMKSLPEIQVSAWLFFVVLVVIPWFCFEYPCT